MPPTKPARGLTARFNRVPTKVLVAFAGGVVAMVTVAYVVAGLLVASSQSKSQAEAMQQTGRDLTKIDAFLSDVTVRDASKTDIKAFKAAIDAYAVKLTATGATLTADQDRMDGIMRSIDYWGWLTTFESGQVHSNDATIRHTNAALDDVVRVVAIGRTEMAFYSVFVSSAINSQDATAAAEKNDLATAAADFQKARNDLAQGELLVKDADVAPQFVPLVDYYARQMADLAGLTGAADSRDLPATIHYLSQLLADSTALTFDQAGFRAWYSKKFGTLEGDFRLHAAHVPRYAKTSTQLV